MDQKEKENEAKPDSRSAARQNLLIARRDVAVAKELIVQLDSQRKEIPSRLWNWSQQPCQCWLVKWILCSTVDAATVASDPPSENRSRTAAFTLVKRMNEIVLPLLLGLLGAFAFVIRSMTAEIVSRSFRNGTAIHHITRLSLGALAGIASSWLFGSDTVSSELVNSAATVLKPIQLKNVPIWVLAFVAGYGIELVFAFMDRIIGAFTSKSS